MVQRLSMAINRQTGVYSTLFLLLTCLCACKASTPFVAWSNREVFSKVTQKDLFDTPSLVADITGELRKLDFVVVFITEKLEFDDIARYGGLYGDGSGAPLAPLQAAVTSAASSVWGESDTADVLAEEIALNNFVTLRYLSDFTVLTASESLQMLVVDLPTSGNRKDVLTQHGSKIAEVMKSLDDINADYAAFYTAVPVYSRPKRSEAQPLLTRSVGAGQGSSDNNDSVCDSTAIISEKLNDTITYCTLMCVRATEVVSGRDSSGKAVNFTTLKAVYWPSWVDQIGKNDTYNGTFVCNMSTFEFDYSTAYCNTSSLQEEYLDDLNVTSSSITAYLSGSCAAENNTGREDISLKVEFIFFSPGIEKSNHHVPLPGKQVLLPGYWTMQLLVTNITNGSNKKSHYMTRFRRNIDITKTDTAGIITEKIGLFYPFVIPSYSSYACRSHNNHLFSDQGNLNRFVATQIPFNSTNVTDGPVLQFVGFHVQAFGNVYNLVDKKTNATLLSFSSVYDCEGYFDISSWMGTFVVVIITVMIYLATLALFSTQTVDRFDDPRGRTITVENLH